MTGPTKQVGALLPNSLSEVLAERIRQQGKITFRDWMNAALYHPSLGYYNRSDIQRWGREGDYRTSPERSQFFATTFAHYFVALFERMGHPSEFTIVEDGAGDGRFAAGVLGALEEKFPYVYSVTRYFVVDVSEDSRRRATEELQKFSSRVQFVRFGELNPISAGIFFSNELLDAFPVHRITNVGGHLKELFVSLQEEAEFVWVTDDLSSDRLYEFCQQYSPNLSEGQIAEVNLHIKDWFREVDKSLESGYLITVDYGAESKDLYNPLERHQGTLRGFHRHKFVDNVLEAPGEYDITSSIDWSYVKSEGRRYGFEVDEFMPLDKFLIRSGLLEILESRLAATTDEAERSCLTTEAREMILPGGMASSFQVLVQKR